MKIQLSDHFTYKKLLRFALPSILMMLFTSIYGIVDGVFVSNFVGKTPFAALNFIYPVIMILGTIGFMFGAGGSALVSKTMGEGDMKRANQLFSLVVYVPAGLSVIIAIVGYILMPEIAFWLGASEEMMEYCILYGRITMGALPFFTMQMEFQTFFVTAEKPNLGFLVTIFAGVCNMALDPLFILVGDMGLAGAAGATAISQMVGGIIPIIYFALPNKSLLRLTKTKFEIKPLIKAATNGFSELLSNIAISVVCILYNYQLMKYAGETGIAAFGIMMYVEMIFFAMFIGFNVGTAPVISYHYGAQNHEELHNLFKKCLTVMIVSGAILFILAEATAVPLAKLFADYDKELFDMTVRGLRFYAGAFLLASVTIFASSFFTALNNGFISALISFSRTGVFEIATIMTMPLLFGIDGIWSATLVARGLTLFISITCLVVLRKKYKY